MNIDVYFNVSLQNKSEVNAFIAKLASENNPSLQEEVIRSLHKREQVGSMFITENVMMPHLESDFIKESRVIFIRPKKPIISWNEEKVEIRMLIVMLLKAEETMAIKKELTAFTRTLADDAYLANLSSIQEKEKFCQAIRRF